MNENHAQKYAETLGKSIENEERTVNNILEEALEIETYYNVHGDYQHAILTLTIGGPNAHINTSTESLEVHWGGQEGHWALPYFIIKELNRSLIDLGI